MRNSDNNTKINTKDNAKFNSKTKQNRLKRKSKLLIRRILIVMALLLVLIAIFQVLGFVYRLFVNDDKAPDFEPDTGYVVSTETSETSTDDTTAIDTTTFETTTDEMESSESEAESTNTDTTQPETDEAQNETTGEVIQMNFQDVSYYLERFNKRYTDYAKQNATLTAAEVVRDVNMNLDFSFYENIGTSPDLNSVQILCNKYFALPDDFSPNKLVDVPADYYVNDGKEYRLNEDALNAFIEMSDAAKQEGLSLKIISAYRSNSYQERLYEKYKAKSSQAEADRYSARPGHSEHETGYGIDINDVAQAFEKTKEFTWLQENAHLYGYILRYPKGLDYLTGYMYEPWHYRYLGTELATKVHQSGLTYDAYYAMYLLK